MKVLAFSFVVAATVVLCSSHTVSEQEWTSYKAAYAKVYSSLSAENAARCNFAFNKYTIDSHNARAAQGLETYTLGVNQFSDLRFVDFADLFPETTEVASNAVPFSLPTINAAESFDYASQGFIAPVQNQGVVCNSGWAYAASVAIKLFDDVNSGALYSPSLSAQNFIDCAGSGKACVNQVAQSAFDYLALHNQRVYPITDYPNRPVSGQRMCILPPSQANGKTLRAYSSIPNGNDALLQKVVNFIAPVVIRFNPGTFEFMHYKSGIFTQPAPIQCASHYVTVVGYGTDATRHKEFWLVQNSFGVSWGEAGYIRIERNPAKPIANAAIFPSE